MPAGGENWVPVDTYDNDFRVATESVNGSQTIAYGYDPDNLATRAGALTLTRDPRTGFLTGTSLGAVTDSRGYSLFGEPASYEARVSGSPTFAFRYERDTLGRIVEKTETVEGVTTVWGYQYDLAGRLEVVTKDGVEVARHAYDLNGNRLAATRNGVTETADYDDQDRLLRHGDTTYTYTANGELRTKTDAAGTTTYTYDPMGNLLRVDLPDGTLIEYLFDGRNRRIGKKVNGQLVQGWLYRDQLKPVAELDSSGQVVARFVYGSNPLVPDYVLKGGATYRILSDHLGSPRLVIDTATGAVEQRLEYNEWGTITLDMNPGFQPFGFAGGLYDAQTGLTRFGARDYDARVGRWTTSDPARFAAPGTNLYAYATEDPVNRIDPTGLSETCVWSGFSLAAAIGIGPGALFQKGRCTDDCGNVTYKTRNCLCFEVGLGASAAFGSEVGDSSSDVEGWAVGALVTVVGSGPSLTGLYYGPGAGAFYSWCACDVF